MTYNPNIPQSTDNISVSQGQLLTNFGQLESIFNVDHFTWDFATSAQRGQHRQVTYPAPASGTSLTAGTVGKEYAVNSASTSNITELFFSNSTVNTQITSGNNAIWKGGTSITNGLVGLNTSNPGFIKFPNGLIMQFGAVSPIVSGGKVTVTYATAFPTNCFSVVATPRTTSTIGGGNHDWDVSNVGLASFQIQASGNYNNSDTFYFIAIGN